MKKLLTGIAAFILVISICSTTVFAAGRGRGRNYVDNDNDGVCDNYNTSCQFVDLDGDGICDNCNSIGCGNCTGYVDADGDGICDNYTAGTSQNGSGSNLKNCGGQGKCCRRGR